MKTYYVEGTIIRRAQCLTGSQVGTLPLEVLLDRLYLSAKRIPYPCTAKIYEVVNGAKRELLGNWPKDFPAIEEKN